MNTFLEISNSNIFLSSGLMPKLKTKIFGEEHYQNRCIHIFVCENFISINQLSKQGQGKNNNRCPFWSGNNTEDRVI